MYLSLEKSEKMSESRKSSKTTLKGSKTPTKKQKGKTKLRNDEKEQEHSWVCKVQQQWNKQQSGLTWDLP